MSDTQQAEPEVLVQAKCGCGAFKPHLSQAQAIEFRTEHRQHEGFAMFAEPVPPPPPGFDPVTTAARLDAANRALKEKWLTTESCLRAVTSTFEAECVRLSAWRGHDLRDYAQAGLATAGPTVDLERFHDAALQVLREVGPALTAAEAAFAAQPRHPVPPPASLEDLMQEDRSQVEQDLRNCRAAYERLRLAVEFYAPALERARAQAQLFVRALLAAMRTVRCEAAATRRAALRLEAEAMAWDPPEELQLLTLLKTLGCEDPGPEVPLIRWPSDPLAPPELA